MSIPSWSGAGLSYSPELVSESASTNPPVAVTVAASAARTSTFTQADQTNTGYTGIRFMVNVTVISGAGITPKLQGKDPVSAAYFDVLVGSVITTTGMNVLKVEPGIGQVANGAAADHLPLTWRVVVTHGDGASVTYSVGAVLFP